MTGRTDGGKARAGRRAWILGSALAVFPAVPALPQVAATGIDPLLAPVLTQEDLPDDGALTAPVLTEDVPDGAAPEAAEALEAVEALEGGPLLTFGIAFRAETGSNLDLSVPSEGETSVLSTRLSFGLSDETRTSNLALNLAGSLAIRNAPDDDTRGLENPALRFAWGQQGARSQLDVTAALTQTELDTLRGFVIDPDTGGIAEDVDGEGTQQRALADVVWTFGEEEPWGITLSAGATITTYSGDNDEDDVDEARLGAALSFMIDPATEGVVDLRWSTYQEEGQEVRDTVHFEVGAVRETARGNLDATLFVDNVPEGTRVGFSVGRGTALPAGNLYYNLGLTRGADGELRGTGVFSWQQALPRGSVSVNLQQEVGANEDDDEAVLTALDVGYTQELTELADLRLGLSASRSIDEDTDLTTDNAGFNATLSYEVSEDWVLDAGYAFRMRDEDATGRANSNNVFLELRRDFEWRP